MSSRQELDVRHLCSLERRHLVNAYEVSSVLSRPPSIGGKLRLLGGSIGRRRREGGEWGGGIPLPSRLGGLGERRELLQWGPGRIPGRKRIWCTLELSESHWWQSF